MPQRHGADGRFRPTLPGAVPGRAYPDLPIKTPKAPKDKGGK